MKKMIVKGKQTLSGEVTVGGAKNSTVALIPAAILADTVVRFDSVPDILDVHNLMIILKSMNVSSHFGHGELMIDPTEIKKAPLPGKAIRSLRASYYFMGALLGRFGEAIVDFPGGDNIGPRPIDQHIKGFEALGAKVVEEKDKVYIKTGPEGLKGARIFFDLVSVGATVNVLLAAVKAKGTTIIENAAKEPEIVDLATFLNNMGAKIRGAGTSKITIEGVKYLHKAMIEVIPDRIEAGTYIILGSLLGKDLIIQNVIKEHLTSLISKLQEIGVQIKIEENNIIINKAEKLSSFNITTLIYPGFPTDLAQPMSVLMTQCDGTSILEETIHSNRMGQVPYLNSMGADITVKNQMAFIKGKTPLFGNDVTASDLRAGASLIIAGLIAKGTTKISDIEHILRGYEHIVEKLTQVGANIKIITEET